MSRTVDRTNKTPQHKLDCMKRQRAKRNADPAKLEAHRTYMREYRAANREKLRDQSRNLWQLNRYKKRLQKLKVAATPEVLAAIQNHSGVCDICSGPPDGKWNELTIDHCHETLQFRSMLCSSCNRALGYLKDDPVLVRKALVYLERQLRKMLPNEYVETPLYKGATL